jgi:hypothetical protein
MKHFGIFITDLESERFLTASNDQIATWLFLHAFCSKQTNGGTIKDAVTLPERFWSRHGITASILPKPSPLWSWNDSDLSVHPYDINGESLYLKKVAGGKKGMETRWNGTADKSLNKSLNRPDLTRPNLTLPKKRRSSTFEKPTLQMVSEYGATLDPPFTKAANFVDYYESNGWKISKAPMRDWQATVRNWNRNEKTNGAKPKPTKANEFRL